MFYKLNNAYCLRGWKGLTNALVRKSEGIVRILSSAEFQALLLCDGVTPLDGFTEVEMLAEILEPFIDEGLVSRCDTPSQIDEYQLYRFYDNRYFESVHWSITGRCNYRCRHCYMDAPDAAFGEFSGDAALALIDQMAACGIMRVDITGGEPFVRDDFWLLVDHLSDRQIRIGTIYTNGSLLNEETLDKFEKRGIRPRFDFSFDGIGWHDWMRGVNGAEQVMLEALKLCKSRGVKVSVEMCLHKGNVTTLRDTINMLAEMGVSSIKCGTVADTRLWLENNQGNTMNVREYIDASIDYIPSFFEDGMPMNVVLGGIIHLNAGSRKYRVVSERHNGSDECLNRHLCGVIRKSCYIAADGRILPCISMTSSQEQKLFPLVQDTGLQKALNDSFYMKFVDSRVKDLLAANEECSKCSHRLYCGGGCRASSALNDFGLMGSDRIQCILWKEGYIERIHRVADEAIAKYCDATIE